jgi:ubiquinone/menaquinone biosynthesis C-methylase UbiE
VSFDRIARYYRWLEVMTFGTVLQKARIRWIKEIPAPKQVLILGEGDGRFLHEFLRVHLSADVHCVDSSEHMLKLAQERVSKLFPHALRHVRFLREDIVSWSPPDSYDLLVVNFVLDCFPKNELNLIVRKLAQTAAPKAYLLLSEFSIPDKPLARVHARTWLTVMYWFFRTATGIRANRLSDPTTELEANGFVCLGRSQWRLGFVKSELWQRRNALI